jgi:hypothetical protein
MKRPDFLTAPQAWVTSARTEHDAVQYAAFTEHQTESPLTAGDWAMAAFIVGCLAGAFVFGPAFRGLF